MALLDRFLHNNCRILIVLAIAGMVFLMVGCEEKVTPMPEVPMVVVVPAMKKDVPVEGRYIGVTYASLDVEVRARVNGFVEEKLFVEGSAVKKGELLYRIDKGPYLSRVNRLRAKHDSDKAALAKTERDIKRLQPLYEQDAVSQLDFDNAISAEEQARANAAASLAELEEAQLELDHTEIRAPISGMASESLVDIGTLVGSGGQSLLTSIKRIDPIFVKFNMSALDYLNAQRRKSYWDKLEAEEKGKALQGFIRINLPDDSEYRYSGDISFTAPAVNPATGTFAVRAILPNPDRELLPGQHTLVSIDLDVVEGAVMVPEETIQIEQGGAYVKVVLPNNTVEQRFIVLGIRAKGEVEIKSGLNAGEHIIIEGLHRARHRQKVKALTKDEYEALKQKQDSEAIKAVEQQGANQ